MGYCEHCNNTGMFVEHYPWWTPSDRVEIASNTPCPWCVGVLVTKERAEFLSRGGIYCVIHPMFGYVALVDRKGL